MPALSVRFPGFMPWHLGGPREMTIGEAYEYVTQHRRALEQERRAASDGRRNAARTKSKRR